MIYNSPLYTHDTNLDMAIGAIKFRDDVIKNLREQIKNLRESLSNYELIEVIEANQYKHLSNADQNRTDL